MASELNQFVSKSDGGLAAAACALHFSERSIRSIRDGQQVPELGRLLSLCYLMDTTPIEVYTGIPSPIERPSAGLNPSFRQSSLSGAHFRPFDEIAVKDRLEAFLIASEEPLLPTSRIARALGYDQSFLIGHFPELCNAISMRYKAHVEQQRRDRLRNLHAEVGQAARELLDRGIYPTEWQLRTVIKRPGAMREPAARHALRETLQELGLVKREDQSDPGLNSGA